MSILELPRLITREIVERETVIQELNLEMNKAVWP